MNQELHNTLGYGDVKAELERIRKQKEEEMAMYPFPNDTNPSNKGGVKDDQKE